MTKLAGYRKLLALVLVSSLATLAKGLGFFDETLAAFLGAVYTAYVGGNFGEHWARAKAPFPPLPQYPAKAPGAASARPGSAIVQTPPRRPARPAERTVDHTDDHCDLLARLDAAGITPEEVRAAVGRGDF